MTNKTTKSALLTSSISLLLCFAMLLGTTFAWFTDSVTSANNIIKSGNLDVEFDYWDGDSWETVKDASDILTNTLWEPGVTEIAYLRVANKGSLALKYQLGVNILSETEGTNVAGETFKLSDSLKFGMLEGKNGETDAFGNDDAGRAAAIAALTNTKKISAGYTKEAEIVANDTDDYFALVVYMPTTVGNEANYKTSEDSSDPDKYRPQINLGINVYATQVENEDDSFGTDYDKNAEYDKPVEVASVDELKTALSKGDNVVLANDIALTSTLMTTKDAVIDLNGNTITAPSSGNMFQSQNNAAPSLIITSSTPGAEINVSGGDTSVLLGYGSTEISNVTINVTGCDNYSPNPFKVYGDLTLGKGTVVNVDYLGTALINNSGKHKIVINGAKINVEKFKTNGGAMISLTSGTTLELKDTEIKVGLDTTYTSYFISKAENATIEGCTFDVKDASDNAYDIEFKPDSAVGAKYAWVMK